MRRAHKIVLILVSMVAAPFATPLSSHLGEAAGSLPVFLGLYPQGSFFDGSAAQEIQGINAWMGDPDKRIAFGATFADLEWPNPDYNVPTEFEAIWDSGAVPFVNLGVGVVTTGRSAQDIANGQIDSDIRAWADAYDGWAKSGGGRRAFIAPLQEMNGKWVPYGQDPANFKLAFKRIRDIFQQRAVPANSVSWVFAPNGWSEPGDEFELYYPGNSLVDVVGFSAYNIGTCVWQWPAWHTFETDFKPYLDRMREMAPSKPIFITQTGSTDWGGDKDDWLDDTFTKLAAYPGVRAILYYHKSQNEGQPCDPVEWRFYAPSAGVEFPGIIAALERPESGFGYWSPGSSNWSNTAFSTRALGNQFEDVEPATPFSGVDDVWYYPYVESLAESGLTGGCGASSLSGMPIYCPEASVTRAEMAVFLERGMRGAGYDPPTASGLVYDDVPASHWAAGWIEQLSADGITAGCGHGDYCPAASVTRAQMAVFLERAGHFPSQYSPPAATGTRFDDVSAGYWAAAWIEQLAADGVTGGCSASPPLYCPETAVTRAQMAAFLVRTFNLPMP